MSKPPSKTDVAGSETVCMLTEADLAANSEAIDLEQSADESPVTKLQRGYELADEPDEGSSVARLVSNASSMRPDIETGKEFYERLRDWADNNPTF